MPTKPYPPDPKPTLPLAFAKPVPPAPPNRAAELAPPTQGAEPGLILAVTDSANWLLKKQNGSHTAVNLKNIPQTLAGKTILEVLKNNVGMSAQNLVPLALGNDLAAWQTHLKNDGLIIARIWSDSFFEVPQISLSEPIIDQFDKRISAATERFVIVTDVIPGDIDQPFALYRVRSGLGPNWAHAGLAWVTAFVAEYRFLEGVGLKP
jgi:hypothetical protein